MEAFFEPSTSPADGLLEDAPALPYGLRPQDFLRVVEDLHEFLHTTNVWLNSRGLPPLEDLHEPAGFSGLISRFAVVRLARLSHGLVVNEQHNGFPDIIPENKFPNNKIKRGDEGIEIKASRYRASWQGHSKRQGWFCVFQFRFDKNRKQSFAQRKPTRLNAVMLAYINSSDWNWYPAQEGKERSGTTQLPPPVVLRLRQRAVWVHPEYRNEHERLIKRALFEEMKAAAHGTYKLGKRELAQQLAISATRLNSILTAHASELNGMWFDFGQGKDPKRRYSDEAIARLTEIIAGAVI